MRTEQSPTVTPDGHRIEEHVPPRGRRFVPRAAFVAMSQQAVSIDLDAFRADQAAFLDPAPTCPYDR